MKNLPAAYSLLFSVFCAAAVNVFAEESAKTAANIETNTDVVRVAVHWTPQAQFAGIFAALEKGYFQKYLPNKKIEIVFPHASERIVEKVGSGELEFSCCWFPEALFYQTLHPDNKIVLLSQVTKTTPMMLVTHSSDGIKSPKDLNGLRVQTWRSCDIMVRYFFLKNNIRPILIPQGGSMMPFIYHGVNSACAMYYNEYHTLLDHGLTQEDIQAFRLSDFGFDFPGDGIYCLEKTYQEQPEICKGIVAAIKDGWTYAVNEANETEMLEIITEYLKKQDVISSKSHQRWMLRTFQPDLTAPYGGKAANGSDTLQEADFNRLLDMFKNSDDIKDKKITVFPKYTDFFPPHVISNVP